VLVLELRHHSLHLLDLSFLVQRVFPFRPRVESRKALDGRRVAGQVVVSLPPLEDERLAHASSTRASSARAERGSHYDSNAARRQAADDPERTPSASNSRNVAISQLKLNITTNQIALLRLRHHLHAFLHSHLM